MATTTRKTTTPARTRTVPQADEAPKRRTRRPQSNVQAEVEIPKVRPVEGYTVDLTAEGEDTERSFEKLLAKDPNETHAEFVAWFEEQTGEKLDIKTVQYTLATYKEFQNSPEHKAKTQAKRQAAARKRAEAEAAKVERARKAAEKAGLKLADADADA